MKRTRRFIVGFAVAGIIASGSGAVLAHNSGHIYTPDGVCHNVGSQKEAPEVGEGNPNRNTTTDPGQLDKIPGPGDQYGARYAAEHSDKIEPGPCP